MAAKNDLAKTSKPALQARTPAPRQPAGKHASSFSSLLGNQQMDALLNTGRVQAKLRLSQPGDPDELEADRVADQVVAAASPSKLSRPSLRSQTATPVATIHRECSCSAGGGKCAACEQEEVPGAKGIHRKSARANGPDEVSESLVSGLGPGRALDSPVRQSMESQLGQNFAGVRIHDDDRAAQSAESISARAYTAGNHIYFSAGNYQPRSRDGQQLLAHELVHVVQQGKHDGAAGASSSGVVSRKNESTTSVTAPTGPPGCTLHQAGEIVPAANLALQWLDKTTTALSRFVAAPADKANKTVSDALRLHFASTDPAIAQRVSQRASLVRNDINSARGRTELTTECHDASDNSCHDAGAYVTGDSNHLVFCPPFFGASRDWQADTIVHEMSHSIFPDGNAFITDRAYQSDRAMSRLTTVEALTNADSFSLFVREIGSGTVQGSAAPSDDFSSNCKDLESPLRDAMAHAQRWNFNADTDVKGSATKAMLEQTVGIDSPQSRQAAQDFYSKAAVAFRSPFKFQCDQDCKSGAAWGEDSGHKALGAGLGAGIGAILGAAVGGALFGFGALLGLGLGLLAGGIIGLVAGAIASGPVIHVCPSWKSQANTAAGTESILAAAYEAVGHSTSDSLKYAKLAAALQVGHPAAGTLDQIDSGTLQRRLEVVQASLVELRKRYQSSNDAFDRSVAGDREKPRDKPAVAGRRSNPADENFDSRVELDRITREGEARLADIRGRTKRAEDAVASVNLAEEIIHLESEAKSIQSQLAAIASKP